MAYFLGFVALFWLVASLLSLRHVSASPRLPAASLLPPLSTQPRVSVIVAGRDEAARIEQTIRRLLAQEGVELELVAVDDRSRDATGEILSRLAAETGRVRVVRIEELPAGWIGKCHACWRGAAEATAPWLLFTDADIHMRPDLIARAIATAERDCADHLTLWPGINCTGPITRATVLALGQCLSIYLSAANINRDRGKTGIGIGAFNLVRRHAYESIGGHVPLKMEAIDDVKLGLLLRRAGFRQRLYSGYDDLEAEWAHSIFQAIRAVEKNWFAGMNYSVLTGIASVTLVLVVWLAGILGPLLHPVWGWLSFAAWCLPILPGFVQTRFYRWPWYIALLVPFGLLTFALAGIHSMWKTLRQGGIRWRDTFYPLADLKAGLVR